MPGELWVYAEQSGSGWHEASIEALADARALAGKLGSPLCSVALGANCPPLQQLGASGVEKAYTCIHPSLASPSLDLYASALAAAVRSHQPRLVLAAATPLADELFAIVAARLNTSFTPGCLGIDIGDDGSQQMVRSVYGGRLHARMAAPSARPPLATLRVAGGSSGPKGKESMPEVITVDLEDLPPSRIEHIGHLKADPTTVDLAEAEVVVAGGRGVGSAAGYQALWDLAAALGGSVGGTRVAVDEGWVPFARQIGQTGKTVAPRLYVACGISGSIHHTAGIKDSRVIVAINSDRQAPIFRMADVGIVGDLHQIVPALTRAVLRAKSQSPAANPATLLADALGLQRENGGTAP